MHRKVKRIHFSENIEVVDPMTRELDKKDAKNFMVNQTSIILDRGQISLSPFDDLIWKQMENYQVVRMSQHGKPQYTSENDHALDAFMLTMLAFTIEFPNITKILEDVQPARKSYIVDRKSTDKIKSKVFDSRDIIGVNRQVKEREAKDNPRWHWNKVAVGYTGKGRTRSVSSRGRGRSSGIIKRSRI